MRHTLIAALLSVLASTASAQNVIVVGPVVTIFDTFALGSAVDAAQNGDIVLVRSGSYSGFHVENKSITVVADLGALVAFMHAVAMSIPANGRVHLRGLRFNSQTFTGTAPLTLVDCAGPVWIEDCTLLGDMHSSTLNGCEISNCASVTFQRSTLMGTSLSANGSRGLLASRSHVSLLDVLVLGGNEH